MNKLAKKLADAWDDSGLTVAQLSAKSGVPESTLRRLRTAESGPSSDTVTDVAMALDVSLDELFGLNPPRTEPQSEDIPRLLQMYETRLAEQKERYESQLAATSALYERAIASGKKRELIKTIAIVILSIILAIYFLYFDVRNGGWGFVQYSSSRYSDSAPNGTSL